MGDEERHGLGYRAVDDDSNVSVLLAAMDATASWDATRRLRRWEREVLGLTSGQRVLDVGCGLGDAVIALGTDVGAAGEIVGIDASAAMIAGARARARGAACQTRFDVGDAATLSEPDSSCDVVRAERTLQWLADPSAAVERMARVVRPGGLVSLLDTDWSTFKLDVGDAEVTAMVQDAFRVERGRPSNVGRRLADLAVGAGLDVVGETRAIHRSTTWDPDTSPAPAGCFSMTSLAANLVETGHLAEGRQRWFVDTVHAAARQGRFAIELTIFALVARRPLPAASAIASRTSRAAPPPNSEYAALLVETLRRRPSVVSSDLTGDWLDQHGEGPAPVVGRVTGVLNEHRNSDVVVRDARGGELVVPSE